MWSAGRDSTESAFTVLELLVVMVIMGLMAVFAVPMLSRSLDTVRLDGAARGLAAAGRKARSEAMATRTPRWLVIDAGGDRFWLARVRADDEVPLQDEVRVMPLVVDILDFRRIDGKVIEETSRIRFDPNGSSSGGTVRMARTGGDGWTQGQKIRKVFFEPFTGLPSVADNTGPEGSER